jgi:hypothetical protein
MRPTGERAGAAGRRRAGRDDPATARPNPSVPRARSRGRKTARDFRKIFSRAARASRSRMRTWFGARSQGASSAPRRRNREIPRENEAFHSIYKMLKRLQDWITLINDYHRLPMPVMERSVFGSKNAKNAPARPFFVFPVAI